VTITHLPVTRYQVCHRTALPARDPEPGPDRALPTAHPEAPALPSQ